MLCDQLIELPELCKINPHVSLETPRTLYCNDSHLVTETSSYSEQKLPKTVIEFSIPFLTPHQLDQIP